MQCLFLSPLKKILGLLMLYGDLHSLCPLSYQGRLFYINLFIRSIKKKTLFDVGEIKSGPYTCNLSLLSQE